MNNFFKYLLLVIKRTFWGADGISKTLGVISLFVAVGFQFTSLPWWVRAGLLLALVFFGTFNVWNDERKVVGVATKKLEDIKNSIPDFEVSIGEVRRYSIKPIIERYADEVTKAEAAVNVKNTHESTVQGSTATGLSNFATQLSSVLSSLPYMMRQENDDEKLERLGEHLAKLRAYEAKLEQLYKIDISLIATRSDKNIEIWIEADGIQGMIVDDNYVKGNIPEMPRNMGSYGGVYMPPSMGNYRVQNKLYLASQGGKNGAYSKIANLNAQRPLLAFEEDFYLLTNMRMANLTVSITSEKRNERQKSAIVVSLENIPTETLQENI